MSWKALANRWTTSVALGAISLASLAPVASAGHGYGHGDKWRREADYGAPRPWDNSLPSRFGYTTRYVVRGRSSCDSRGYGGYTRVIVRERSSSLGPALAGLVGGFVLGAAVSNAGVDHCYAPPAASTYYYDPYCDERFSSLDA